MNDPPMLDRIWSALSDEERPPVAMTGPETVLPAVFDVTALATAAIAAASAAVARFAAGRDGGRGTVPAVTVDRRAASAAFLSEALFTPVGWQRPPVWDPIAGDYATRDGWIRLHTNYAYHRAAAVEVLGEAADHDEMAPRVAEWSASELESAVVEAGGCAATMHDRTAWLSTAAGQASRAEPLTRVTRAPGPPVTRVGEASSAGTGPAPLPLHGIRVLDLTRVIAGPVATRFLAAYGADVLRIDPPGFAEVGALLPETTVGKRCAALDLRATDDRPTFDRLLATADVIVSGLRPGALDRLGYDTATLRAHNPGLIIAGHNAYGWTGPWAGRRGFDSLVQMSTGIAAAGARRLGRDRPAPLPAQALDHATGYIVAAAVAAALTRRADCGEVSEIRASLVATANLLIDHPTADSPESTDTPHWQPTDTVATHTQWGPARRVPVAGRIAGVAPSFAVEAGELGRHPAEWATGS